MTKTDIQLKQLDLFETKVNVDNNGYESLTPEERSEKQDNKIKRRTSIIITKQLNPKDRIAPEDIVQPAPRPIVADPTEEGYVKDFFTEEEAEEVARENVKLVYYVANYFQTTGISVDELSSVGFLGYAKAIKTYDKNRNVKFSTYAINVIKNEIFYFLRREKKHRTNNTSLNKILSTDQNGSPFELSDILEDDKFTPLDEEAVISDRLSILLEIIDRLPENERYIILNRFELTGNVKKTQKTIAEEINMSQANVSKLQKNAIKKLKFYLQLKSENKDLTLGEALEV